MLCSMCWKTLESQNKDQGMFTLAFIVYFPTPQQLSKNKKQTNQPTKPPNPLLVLGS